MVQASEFKPLEKQVLIKLRVQLILEIVHFDASHTHTRVRAEAQLLRLTFEVLVELPNG